MGVLHATLILPFFFFLECPENWAVSAEFVNTKMGMLPTWKLHLGGGALCGLISVGPTLLLKPITYCVTLSLFTASRLRAKRPGWSPLTHSLVLIKTSSFIYAATN